MRSRFSVRLQRTYASTMGRAGVKQFSSTVWSTAAFPTTASFPRGFAFSSLPASRHVHSRVSFRFDTQIPCWRQAGRFGPGPFSRSLRSCGLLPPSLGLSPPCQRRSGMGAKQEYRRSPYLKPWKVSHRGSGRAGDAASPPGCTWDHHRKFALVATLCRCKGFMMDLGMLRLTPP